MHQIHVRWRQKRSRVHTHTYTRTYMRKRPHVHSPAPYYSPGRDFFITVRADCIFLRLSTTGASNLENRVEGGPSNHVFLAIVFRVGPDYPPSSRPRILILGHNPLLGRTKGLLFDGRRVDRDTVPLFLYPPPPPLFLSIFMWSPFSLFFAPHRPPFHHPGTPLQSGLAARRN